MRRAKPRCSGGWRRRWVQVRQVLIESATQGRTEHFMPVAIAGEAPGAVRALVMAGHDGARLTV